MKTIWLVILSLVALLIGAFGGFFWKATKTSVAGFRVSCELIAEAERSGAMSQAQVKATIERMSKRIAERKGRDDLDLEDFAKELQDGCKTFGSQAK